MDAFDQQVAELRAKGVPPKCYGKGKAKATPEQWAANLEYHKRFGSQASVKQSRRNWYHKNYELTRERIRRWQSQNPDRHATFVVKAHLFRSYGLTPAQYEAMRAGQAGGCAICGEPCATGKRLSVDHCHDSMAVRGLLCGTCNSGIGMFKDKPDLLRKAAEYLDAGGTQAFDLVTFYQRVMETTNERN